MSEPTTITTETDNQSRVFIYGDHRFDDPGSEWTNEQMRDHLATYFPEIAGGKIETAEKDNVVEIRFSKRVTTKGSVGVPAIWESLMQVAPAERTDLDALMSQLAEIASKSRSVTDLAADAQAHWQLIQKLERYNTQPTQLIERCLTLSPTPSQITPIGF